MAKPIILLTMGDPAGVGPETIIGAWANPLIHEACRPVVLGHSEIFRRAARLWQSRLTVTPIDDVDQAKPSMEVVPCIDTLESQILDFQPGRIDAKCGHAAYTSVVAAAQLVLSGRADALVTAPLHKAALWHAGHHFPGHTELLAELCGTKDFAMALYLRGVHGLIPSHGLAVAHVTLHMSLRQALESLNRERILQTIELVRDFMARLKSGQPKIGVAAVNPHAGEEGLFGDEEALTIRPAVTAARTAGILAEGPLPVDTLMVRARDGEFDAVVAMYHDQGHIAVKLLGMHSAVNVTLGLPMVRTSVAHGTAFDLAWQGKAETSGMVEAIRVAAQLVQCRKGHTAVSPS